MKLSKNLSLKEVTKSITASRLGIDNTPSEPVVQNLKHIAEDVFQPIRDHFGVPIAVSSGYRSKELNSAIGGSKSSQHMSGEALDLDADVYGKITNRQIFEFIKDNLTFDQMIWEYGDDNEPNWVHVSYKKNGENKKRILQAKRDNENKTYYTLYQTSMFE
jgi:zinc D-Ala-D-Ala carboxypeptidase